MKKLIVAVVMVFLLSACGQKTETTKTGITDKTETQSVSAQTIIGFEASVRNFTLNEVLANYPLIFTGVCTEEADKTINGLPVGRIRVENILRGDEKEKEIPLQDMEKVLIAGEEYFVFARKWESVFTQTFCYSGIILGISKSTGQEHIIRDFDGKNYRELEKRIVASAVKFNSAEEDVVIGEYIKSTDISEIIRQSPYVLKLQVIDILADREDRKTVLAKVLDTLKGKTAEEISVVVTKDVEIGKQYYMLLTKPDQGASFFSISSPYSIYEAESEEGKKLAELLQ